MMTYSITITAVPNSSFMTDDYLNNTSKAIIVYDAYSNTTAHVHDQLRQNLMYGEFINMKWPNTIQSKYKKEFIQVGQDPSLFDLMQQMF